MPEAPLRRTALLTGYEGGGDPYFPYAGSTGYDASHYDLALDHTPPTDPQVLEGQLEGVATIDLTVGPRKLDALTLDLRGSDVHSVTVDGWATYGEWSWRAHRGGPSLTQRFDSAKAYLDRGDRWALDITDPGGDHRRLPGGVREGHRP